MIEKILSNISKAFSDFQRKRDVWYFTRDEYLTVYEAILYAIFVNRHILNANYDQDVLEDFRQYENAIVHGIKNGDISIIEGIAKVESERTSKLFMHIFKLSAAKFELATKQSSILENCSNPYKIDMILMHKVIRTEDVLKYYIDSKLFKSSELAFGDSAQLLSSESLSASCAETSDSENRSEKELNTQGNTSFYDIAAVDNVDLIKQIRREAGSLKGEKWRDFERKAIIPTIRREFAYGCLCLHDAMAERLTDEFITQYKTKCDLKEFNKIRAGLPAKISKSIIKAFYALEEEYPTAQSRVYRGKYYDKEYDHAPCPHHSGK
ncbi:hypothetical protein [Trichlorobacter lovleyi]|uniref:hypothetical protein n=1 Tax=Trichlorobacter lovleyi TaxID=313985 RepID=UPI0024803844|nr:hypothetical protein [Trichlorobacter lovleyi]